jgi:hypothetical protein
MAVDYLKTYLGIDPNDYSCNGSPHPWRRATSTISTHDETTHDDAATKKFGRHRSHANDAKADNQPHNQPHKWMIDIKA